MVRNFHANILMFIISLAMLFTELVLVRWVTTEIRIFAYVQNFVLLACFLGIGAGCVRSRRPPAIWPALLALGAIIASVTLPLPVVHNGIKLHLVRDIPVFLAAFDNTVIHYQSTTTNLIFFQMLGVVLTFMLFLLIATVMFPLGQAMGRAFDEHPSTVEAYSVNVAASLLGVWVFSMLSFISTPPALWFLLALCSLGSVAHMSGALDRRSMIAGALCLFLVVVMFVMFLDRGREGLSLWSPYQKISMKPLAPDPEGGDPYKVRSKGGYNLSVNSVGFMGMTDLSRKPGQTQALIDPPWDMPYAIAKGAASVLILGGGAGNDAAAALRGGFKDIDVVEIDPAIVALGEKYHPNDVYHDPRVHVILDDARSFMNRTARQYDVVHFGLLDSHSQSSSYNNIRMDHYVYTRESFREAKRLLKPDGLFVVTFHIQRVWIGQRLQSLLRETFGWDPVVIDVDQRGDGRGKVVMVCGYDRLQVLQRIAGNPEVFPFVKEHTMAYANIVKDLRVTTDDWPYLYITRPMIPTMHIILISILIVAGFLTRGMVFPRGDRLDWHFFFLGAAFLLLEFQNINKTSLLFGSTWLVNSFNISAILILILAANLTAVRVRYLDPRLAYIGLAVSLVIIWVVPLAAYARLDYWPRALLSSLVLNLPVYFAGLIFITSFRTTPKKHLAYASNLMGATAGGLLEYISFLTGVHALVLVTIVLYALSFVLRPKE